MPEKKEICLAFLSRIAMDNGCKQSGKKTIIILQMRGEGMVCQIIKDIFIMYTITKMDIKKIMLGLSGWKK